MKKKKKKKKMPTEINHPPHVYKNYEKSPFVSVPEIRSTRLVKYFSAHEEKFPYYPRGHAISPNYFAVEMRNFKIIYQHLLSVILACPTPLRTYF